SVPRWTGSRSWAGGRARRPAQRFPVPPPPARPCASPPGSRPRRGDRGGSSRPRPGRPDRQRPRWPGRRRCGSTPRRRTRGAGTPGGGRDRRPAPPPRLVDPPARSTAARTAQPRPRRSRRAPCGKVAAEQRLVVRLRRLVLLLRGEEALAVLLELLLPPREVLQGPDVHQDLLEGFRVVRAAEDEVQFPDHELEHVDLLVEEGDHVLFDRVPRPEVHDVDLAGLPEAVDPPDPLLDLQRVPREVEVDHGVGELKVAPLPSRLRAQEDAAPLAEGAHGIV